MVEVCKVSRDGELKRWVATCGWILLFLLGVGDVDDSDLSEVKYYGLVISIFRGVGCDLCVYFRTTGTLAPMPTSSKSLSQPSLRVPELAPVRLSP